MKQGKTLTQLAIEIERQLESKVDMAADTNALEVFHEPEHGGVDMIIPNMGIAGINKVAHEQIGARLGIPKPYYDRMLSDAPSLLETNINHWFRNKPEKRMLRLLDGNVRAFLSNRYRRIDNYDLMEVVLPKVQEMNCEIQSCELTERRLYLKATTARVEGEVQKNDIVQAGLVVSNSEVGLGSVRVEPMIYRLACLNGLILKDRGMKKYHIGRGVDLQEGEGASEFYRDETMEADDKAFFLKVRDIVAGVLTREIFDGILVDLRRANEREITGSIEGAVEVITKRHSLTQGESEGILKHLIQGGDLSQYGIANAVTRMSQDVDDYDRATDMEKLGGQIIDMPDGS